ncbi:MAG: hypothetical protein AVO33_10830 [delta proteobacterium ML8_F1]|nr:MAG: hypothetical protein AVO33_10830 [delta proteobacterium ML8_F1]
MNEAYEAAKSRIEEGLKGVFTRADNAYEAYFNEVMNYSLLSGGKRLRPVLMLKTTEILGGPVDTALRMGLAIEMIHTYSLIHDDLPAMDDDALRRGQPTAHKQFNEALAILSGDGLLNKAYEIMTEAVCTATDPRTTALCVATIAGAAGEKGMIGGQVVDIESEHINLEPELLDYLIINKTARLITAPLIGAGILSGLPKEKLTALERVGLLMGFSFQLQDDLLDLEGEARVMGKASNRDALLGKNTYPAHYGLEKTKRTIEASLEEAESILRNMDEYDWSFMIELIQELQKREK